MSRRDAAGRSEAPCSPVRARMTSTRSPLRILDVPLTPSCDASACSSGRRRVESAPFRAVPPAAVALLVAVSMVSVTKDPSPSFASVSQRADRGWSTPGRDGRCAGVTTRQWYDDVI
ncbi:Uncharacterised protein [Mycobacteroides abscessus]|nr:Uncharacterised protein [Mycobacteroides abscessus]